LSGEGWYREVVPFLLDYKNAFHRVPPTSLVEVYNPIFAFNNDYDPFYQSGYQKSVSKYLPEDEIST
jgi:hypothetical protein